MTMKIEPASRASDLGAYAEELDRTLARPSEQVGLGVSAPEPGPERREPIGPEPLDPDALILPVATVGAVITSRTGTAPLTESEQRQLSAALAPVCDKYAGDFFEHYAEEIGLATVLAVIIRPRMKEVQQRSRVSAQAEADSRELAGEAPEPEPDEEPEEGAE